MTEQFVEPKHVASPDESIIEWFQRNSRALIVGAVVIAAGTGAYWFYTRSVELKNQQAERALNTALQSVQAGNKALAQSDLQKVVDQYGDTQSGIEAGLILAQINFNGGKVAEGVSLLEKLASTSAATMDLQSIRGLIGDGQMEANKPAEAARAYQQAADAARTDADSSYQLSKAARALLAAGDTSAAKTIWQKLAADPKGQGVAAEARVRLGEIEAKPARKG